jgi:hypothetical protein
MLNFLIWVILIYFAIMLIWRYVVPFLLKRYFRKLEKKFNQYQHGREDMNRRRDGEVQIEDLPDQPIKETRPVDETEYVDFEEIKEDEQKKNCNYPEQ